MIHLALLVVSAVILWVAASWVGHRFLLWLDKVQTPKSREMTHAELVAYLRNAQRELQVGDVDHAEIVRVMMIHRHLTYKQVYDLTVRHHYERLPQ